MTSSFMEKENRIGWQLGRVIGSRRMRAEWAFYRQRSWRG